MSTNISPSSSEAEMAALKNVLYVSIQTDCSSEGGTTFSMKLRTEKVVSRLFMNAFLITKRKPKKKKKYEKNKII
jgi:hypothetical protein